MRSADYDAARNDWRADGLAKAAARAELDSEIVSSDGAEGRPSISVSSDYERLRIQIVNLDQRVAGGGAGDT